MRSSYLLNSAPLHHHHLIIVSNCIEAVSDGNHCCAYKLPFDALLDKLICLHVHIRCGFIKDQELVVTKQCSRQTQQLLLTH